MATPAKSYLASVDPETVVSPIDMATRFPELLAQARAKYGEAIAVFQKLIAESASSGDLLTRIRSEKFPGAMRMSLLKLFRRCVSPVLDTEKSKKIRKVTTASIIASLGPTFKDISVLQGQFAAISDDQIAALAALIGEYDTRGQLGYQLTATFFEWFEAAHGKAFKIIGPRGAGRDIEIVTVLPDWTEGNYPCDFAISDARSASLMAVGFARYDSTRGGAQSDDRTGGNSDKVSKARAYAAKSGRKFRILFLADGPGLTHRDTWEEACKLDDSWDGNVRVVTLRLALARVTEPWLRAGA